MKIYVIVLCACWGACRSAIDHDLRIPGPVPLRAVSTVAVPDTRLRIHLPPGFSFDSSLRAYIDGRGASLRMVYAPGHDIDDSVYRLRRGLAGRRIYYAEDFAIGDCPAQLFYGKADTAGKDQIFVFLQSNSFSAAAIATLPDNDVSVRDSMVAALLSMRSQLPTEIAERQSFTLDLSGSEFAYCNSWGTAYFYTIDGVDNPHFLLDRDQFMVIELLPEKGATLKERIDRVLDTYAAAGLRVTDSALENTFVRSEPALEFMGEMRCHGKPGRIYLLAMGDAHRALVFSALLYADIDQRFNEILPIARSMQFKNPVSL